MNCKEEPWELSTIEVGYCIQQSNNNEYKEPRIYQPIENDIIMHKRIM